MLDPQIVLILEIRDSYILKIIEKVIPVSSNGIEKGNKLLHAMRKIVTVIFLYISKYIQYYNSYSVYAQI